MEIVLPCALQQTFDFKWVWESENVYPVPQARVIHPGKRDNCHPSANFKSNEVRNGVFKTHLPELRCKSEYHWINSMVGNSE